ncbi:HNH endonuclease signature motif containing protein [Pectobacterium sp. CFBP8739]|uniref:HNH endonuclease n=1 Tax=Pectobacterium sp. CFBP8739 TaxID=2748908 RepID=UPI0015DF5ABE|nr:HNH endonuclease signature motif containing protein [Pectobacterium sp. CFBP8739]MBA0167950.1 HNH endonuclease [Pectobacterium sp. CFBP8739]
MERSFNELFNLPIYQYCENAYLVYGTPRLDQQNRTLLAENKTGYWKVKEGRIKEGDLIVLLLKKVEQSDCYELFSGVMQQLERNERGGVVITVDEFKKFTEIVNQPITKYLSGCSIPQGNKINKITMPANRLKNSDTIDEVEIARVEFNQQVIRAMNDSSAARQERIAGRKQSVPSFSVKKTKVYHRNPDIVAERLHRAKGICEICKQKAPFTRKSDGKPYLEVHHRIFLSEGGEDTLENTIAICPNCHRHAHHG